MTENEISGLIVDTCYQIHVELGPGLFEKVYEEVLAFELHSRGLVFKRQHPISLEWRDIEFDQGFRADMIVEDKVLVEIKSVERIAPVHKKQVLTYLRLSNLKLGLLINFNEALIKNGICRVVDGL